MKNFIIFVDDLTVLVDIKKKLHNLLGVPVDSMEFQFIVLALLFGAGVGIAQAHSVSYFLQNVEALWTLPCLLISEALYLPIIRTSRKDIKFASSVSFVGILMSFLMILNYFNPSVVSGAVVFFILTVMMRNFVRWMLFELLFLHVDRSKANEFSYMLSSALDVGSVIVLPVLLVTSTTAVITLSLVGALWGAVFIYTYKNFNNPELFEIKTNFEEFKGESWEEKPKKKVLVSYLGLTFIVGFMYALQEYLWRATLQNENTIKGSVFLYTTFYVLGSNLFGIVGGWVTGKAMKNKRLSPQIVINYYFAFMASSLFLFSLFKNSETAVILGIICSGGYRSFFSSAHHTLMSCFNEEERIFYRRRSQLTLFIFPLVPVFVIAFCISNYLNEDGLFFTIATLDLLILASFFQLKIYISNMIDLMFIYLHSEDRFRKVTGALLLSFIRPKGLDRWFEDVFQSAPKTLLLKTIIDALSFYPTKRSLRLILSHKNHPKEEIRLAVCEALYRINKPQSQAALINISLDAKMPLQVRKKSVHFLQSIMKQNIVAVYLHILEEETINKKLLALEALSELDNKQLVQEFLHYAEHSDPDVVRFSLIGLYKVATSKKYYTDKIQTFLVDKDSEKFVIACKVIGSVRDKTWIEQVKSQRPKGKISKLYQYWCLFRLQGTLDYEIMRVLRVTILDPNNLPEIISIFVQLDRKERLEIIFHLTHLSNKLRISPEDLMNLLKNTYFDLHEEIMFLQHLYKKNSSSRKLMQKLSA